MVIKIQELHLDYFNKYYFIDDVAYKISAYLSKYRVYIQKLKNENFIIVGYVRKSPGEEPIENRVRLLNNMVSKLKDRSLIDIVFASPSCKASDPITHRDVVRDTNLNKLDVAGDINGKKIY